MFSISDLQQLSGIKAHTIRMWEHRYNALRPHRSEGNTRYYDNSQLRRLLNIVSLMNNDHKVSELCAMPDAEIFKLVEKHSKDTLYIDEFFEHFVSQMIVAGIGYDEPYFEKLFSTCILRFGMKKTYKQVIYPLLMRVGLMWSKDTLPPAQEHFMTNIIRQKLAVAIDALPPPKTLEKTWLLFLPENEFHEIGLLFAHYLIRQAGKKVIYLGSNVPSESLNNAVKETKATHLLFFFVHHNDVEESRQYLSELAKSCKGRHIHVSGNQKLIQQLKTGKDIHWIQTIEQLELEILK